MAFSSATCEASVPYNDEILRFDARYFTVDYPLTATATIIADTPDELAVHCVTRSNRDLIGLLWNSRDEHGHAYFQYEENRDYTGVTWAFVANPHDPYDFNLTIDGVGGSLTYRLYPYVISGGTVTPRVSNETRNGAGPGTYYSVSSIFPDGAPTLGSGEYVFVVDFDDLRQGYNFDEARISPVGIRSLFMGLRTDSYGLGRNAMLNNCGRVEYAALPDAWGLLNVKGGSYVDTFTIRNVNPNLRIKRGDIITMTLVQPGEFVRQYSGKKGESYLLYKAVISNVDVECQEVALSGSTLRITIPNGPYENSAWLGGPCKAKSLQLDSVVGAEEFVFRVRSIAVTGDGRTIGVRNYPQDVHGMRMTSGYDDTYSITPWRQAYQVFNLGYRGMFTMYMGMSHYFQAHSEGNRHRFELVLESDGAHVLNEPTRAFCNEFFRLLQERGYTLVWSSSYEILNTFMPEEWAQLDARGERGLSGWSPPSAFIIPTKQACLDFLSAVICEGLQIAYDQGMTDVRFQIGEPWWWDGSYTNGYPCIYDPHTMSLYAMETGQSVPEPHITSYTEPVAAEQRPYLEWLGEKLGQSTSIIRDAVKERHPDALSTLLFFTPQIMNPASEMLEIINFPVEQWKYPAYDFMQIEDYDWIIDGDYELLPLTREAALHVLAYPVERVHYFVGFVLEQDHTWIWPSINIATRDAIVAGLQHLYVWAYPQVIRDSILYDDTLYGTQPAIQPDLPRMRQVSGVEGIHLTPVFLLKIGDDIRINSTDRVMAFEGEQYVGSGEFGRMEFMKEGKTNSETGWNMQLVGVPLAGIASEEYDLRDRPARLSLGLLGEDGDFAVQPRLISSGRVYSSSVEVDGTFGVISVSVRSLLASWYRARSATFTDEYQQLLHAGDRGFRFMAALMNQKVNWGGTVV